MKELQHFLRGACYVLLLLAACVIPFARAQQTNAKEKQLASTIRFGPVDAPVNTLGIRRLMFAVDDIDAVVARIRAHGAELIGEMQYEDTRRLAYIRGPEGIMVALNEDLG